MGLRGLIILPGPPNTGKSALGHQFGMDVVVNNDNACFVYVALRCAKRTISTACGPGWQAWDYKTFRTGLVSPQAHGGIHQGGANAATPG